MKKILFSALIFVAFLAVCLIGLYNINKAYFRDMAARVVIGKSDSGLIPKRIRNQIQAISRPLNKGTGEMLTQMHASGITIDQILAVVDNTTEEQAYDILDEINSTKPETTDEVFDILQKHLNLGFDPEIFRRAFTGHISMKQVRLAVSHLNQNRKTHDVEFSTARAIIKMILLQEDKDYRKSEK